MEALNRETRTSVYFQIAFTLAVPWPAAKAGTIDFQKALLENGLDFSQTDLRANNFGLLRAQPSNLQVKLQAVAPQVSSIQIISQDPSCDLDMFVRDAEAVMGAYQRTWPQQQYQILRTTAKIQHLYSCRDHAFKYLWETRLGQSPDDFACLGKRPVAGGGLRLMMPAYAQGDEEPCSIEIRIESFLREPGKLLIETAFVWPKPLMLTQEMKFDPAERLTSLEQYATGEVWEFLAQKKDA